MTDEERIAMAIDAIDVESEALAEQFYELIQRFPPSDFSRLIALQALAVVAATMHEQLECSPGMEAWFQLVRNIVAQDGAPRSIQ